MPHTQPVARRRAGAEGRSSSSEVTGLERRRSRAARRISARLVNFGYPDVV